jgi:hypothetical protein
MYIYLSDISLKSEVKNVGSGQVFRLKVEGSKLKVEG